MAHTWLDLNPETIRQRRGVVEHPFGPIRMHMGATRFLMKQLPEAWSGMALQWQGQRRLPRLYIHCEQP
jgi:hypothetical protein